MANNTIATINADMGSMLIGVIISAVLYGISLVQTFYYYISYPDDVWYLQALVASTVVFDTVHLGMISHTIYHYLVSNYATPDSLQILTSSVLLEALFTGLTGAFVQTYYTARIWRLSKRNIFLSAFIFFLVVGNAGCGTAWVIISMQMATFEELLTISALTLTINALSTAIDVMIAATLCIILNKARTGFKRSDTIINRLILFVVNTGVLTSVCAIGSLIAIIASPNTLIYASFYFCIGRFYTNSLLATLNARKSLTGSKDDVSHMLVSLPPTTQSGSMGAIPALDRPKPKNQPNIAIRIDTTKESIHEERMMDEISRSDDDFSRKNHSL